MDFKEVITSRRSVRSFIDKEISEEIIEEMMIAAQSSPSCQNKQCWRFVVVRDEVVRKELAFNSGLIGTVNFFIKDAPLIVIACAEPSRSCKLNGQDYYLVDTAIAFQQMMLTAWNYGVGSCWLAAFNEEKVKKILGIPDKIRVVGISPFGYPKEKNTLYAQAVSAFAGSKKRISLDKIISYNKWEL